LVSSLTTLLRLSATTRSVAGRPLGLFTLSTVAASESRQPRGSLLHRIGSGHRSRGEQLRAVTALTGEGDWPAGMLSHSAGATPNGWTVVEVCESREAQEKFMQSRLGAALGQAGVRLAPTRADWTTLHAHHTPQRGAAASS